VPSSYLLRRGRLLLVSCVAVVVAACGGGGGGDADIDPPPGEPLKLVLVESSEAPPALVGDECVVFTERPSMSELARYTSGRVPDIFEHVGRSARQCLDGAAQTYLGQLPPQYFFRSTLYINRDGQCPQGASGCYYPNNPTIDLIQTVLSLVPEIARRQLDRLLGHEIWHAVAGSFHAV
jgi:hypothetical protein